MGAVSLNMYNAGAYDRLRNDNDFPALPPGATGQRTVQRSYAPPFDFMMEPRMRAAFATLAGRSVVIYRPTAEEYAAGFDALLHRFYPRADLATLRDSPDLAVARHLFNETSCNEVVLPVHPRLRPATRNVAEKSPVKLPAPPKAERLQKLGTTLVKLDADKRAQNRPEMLAQLRMAALVFGVYAPIRAQLEDERKKAIANRNTARANDLGELIAAMDRAARAVLSEPLDPSSISQFSPRTNALRRAVREALQANGASEAQARRSVFCADPNDPIGALSDVGVYDLLR